MLHYLRLMLQILMAPRRGWEDVAADDGCCPRHILFQGLIPLAGIAALSVGTGFLYKNDAHIDVMLITAIVTFARYVLTYFIAVALLMYALPKLAENGVAVKRNVELLSAYCVGIMALIGIFENLLPMEIPLLQFLPLYVVVVIIQSRWFINVAETSLFRYAACAIAGIILPVFLIDRIILP